MHFFHQDQKRERKPRVIRRLCIWRSLGGDPFAITMHGCFEIRWSLDSSLYSKCRRRPTLGTRWHMDVQRTTLLAVITGDPWFPVKRRHTAFSQVLTKKGRDVLRMYHPPQQVAFLLSRIPRPCIQYIHTHVRVGARARTQTHTSQKRCAACSSFGSRP